MSKNANVELLLHRASSSDLHSQEHGAVIRPLANTPHICVILQCSIQDERCV